MTLSFLTAEAPYPVNSGAKMREGFLLRLLAEHGPVELFHFGNAAAKMPHGLTARPLARQRETFLKRATYPLRPYVVNGFSQEMVELLRDRFVPGAQLWISKLGMGQYARHARAIGYRVVLDEQNIETLVLLDAARAGRRLGLLPIVAQCAWYERRFTEVADAVVTVSALDAARLRRISPKARIHVVPNLIDVASYDRVRRGTGSTLFFAGTLDYGPNIEGLEWFARACVPRLREKLGSGTPPMVVAGAKPSSSLVARLEAAGVRVVANPLDMLPLLAEARVVIVPLLSGGGSRLKILEAMAAEKPVVSTTKGAEGLELTRLDLEIADGEEAFAEAVVRLVRDPNAAADLACNGRRTVTAKYDWTSARSVVGDLVASLQ